MHSRFLRILTISIALTLALNAVWAPESGDARTIGTEPAGQSAEQAAGAQSAVQGKGDRVLPSNMTVGGMAVGGLRSNEAIDRIRAGIAAALDGKVTIVNAEKGDGDAADANPLKNTPAWRELGLSLNADEAIRAIERYRDAGWLNRRAARRSLERRYSLAAAWDEEVFAEKAETLWGERAEKKPIDAVRSIDPWDRVVYAPESPGTALDVASLLAAFKRHAPAALTGKPADPLQLDIRLPVVPVTPEITTASLKAEGIARKIAEFSTSFAASGAGRVHNVTATADALDGTLLNPGDTFDYEAIVSKARRDFGYRAAPVILKGKLVPGIGGGICQVSSTLYNAVVRASDLAIVERRNHSLPVNYLPAGLDATFAEGYINFRFRNDTGKRLLIKTVLRDKRLTVKLFGTMPDNVRYELQTVRERNIAPRIVYIGDAGLPLGMSRLVQQGRAGSVIDTYRLKYVDGQLADRGKLNRSTYRAQDAIVAVHPADPRARVPQTPPQGQSPAEPM